MVVLSPLARGGGYFNRVHYTHSSMLRTSQDIFGVMPLLGDAANANDLSDLFSRFAIADANLLTNGAIQLTVVGVIPGRTNVVQASSNLASWTAISTNVSATNTFGIVDLPPTNFTQRFYRLVQLP